MFALRKALLVVGLACFSFSLPTSGATFSGERVTKTNPTLTSGCIDPPSASSFVTADNTVYLYFYATVSGNDNLSIDWVGPDSVVRPAGNWGSLSGSYCFVGPSLTITNTPANLLGQWRARVWDNGTLLFALGFNIVAGPSGSVPTSSGPPTISSLSRSQFVAGELDLALMGNTFQAGAVVSVDYYVTDTEYSWNVAPAVSTQFNSQTQLQLHLSLPQAGEFRLTVKNPDLQHSNVTPIIVGYGGFRMPFAGGTLVTIQQGNNDTPDHHGSLAWSYDLTGGQTLLAMRGGRVHLGPNYLGQTCSPGDNGFGNYITIDHQNGQYSHYAHMAANSFLVHEGDMVTQGQPLGTLGNSGYTGYVENGQLITCNGRGFHTHVQVTTNSSIGSQSVPFLFDEVNSRNPAGSPPGQPVYTDVITSSNASGTSGSAPTAGSTTEADLAWTAIRNRAKSDGRFGSEVSGSQYLDPNWGKNDGNSGMRDLRHIDFNFSGGRVVHVFHAFYNIIGPNLGATVFFDPDRNAWADWINVQP
jgi:hypothetical protein